MGNRNRTYIPIYEAQPRNRLAPSRPSPLFLAFARAISPLYLRHVLKFHDIILQHPEIPVSAFRKFQNKETRMILAFRHPYGDEPQLLQFAFDCLVPREARKSGTPLSWRPHVRFVHGYEVALWGDALIRFVLPLSGAVPIHHLQADPTGMKRIREILLNGDCPLALAPEGQVSYRSGTVPRLEHGTARMGFWCARDLEKNGRHEQAVILPVSVHHAYRIQDAKRLLHLVGSLEGFCGIRKTTGMHAAKDISPAFRQTLRQRLLRVESELIQLAEAHYGLASGPDTTASEARQARWDALMEAALQAGERILGLPAHPRTSGLDARDALLESRIARVYRIRREGWERIRPMDMTGVPLQRFLRHRQAGEAWYAMRHMEFVDILEYLDTAYLDAEGNLDGPSYDRLCETAINLHDLAHRLAGGNFTNRTNKIRKTAIIRSGDPINLSEKLPAYKTDMRKAVWEVTDQMRKAFLSLAQTNERRNHP